jgi:hypothetical protein
MPFKLIVMHYQLVLITPSGATWSLPSTSVMPQITLCAGLGTLLGFQSNLTFPTLSSFTTTQQYISDIAPTISVVNSYILILNLLNNDMGTPNNIFYAMPLGNSAYGSAMITNNSSITYNAISPGIYKTIELSIIDQNFNDVTLIDKEATFVLTFLSP